MKKFHKLVILILVAFNHSCQKINDDCEAKYCFSPPMPFEFELVDKSTSENLFTNGTYDPKDIAVVNLENKSLIEHNFIDENDINVIRINTVGWQTETVNYSIQVAKEPIFELFVEAERLSENCCAFTK